MPIFKLDPKGKDYLWGGNRLKEEYDKHINLTPLAESWECSVHPDGPSTILNDEYKGKTLKEVLDIHPEYIGSKNKETGFPILVKYIDAKKDLSVQVHPDDEYARKNENDNGKTEMWYVLDAKEGSNLIYGFSHKVNKDILKESVEKGTLDKHLQKVKVHKGDVFYVPAGTVHGIGEGVLIAEIQESSNVTYRVYDYDRKDKNGKKRELHFDKATEVLNMDISPEVRQDIRIINHRPGCFIETLCRCKYFEVERIGISKSYVFDVNESSFQVLMCIDGYGQIEKDDDNSPIRFHKGETLFISAGTGKCLITGDVTLLKIRC